MDSFDTWRNPWSDGSSSKIFFHGMSLFFNAARNLLVEIWRRKLNFSFFWYKTPLRLGKLWLLESRCSKWGSRLFLTLCSLGRWCISPHLCQEVLQGGQKVNWGNITNIKLKSGSLGLRKKTARTTPEQQRKTQSSRSKWGRPGSVMYLATNIKTRQLLKVSLQSMERCSLKVVLQVVQKHLSASTVASFPFLRCFWNDGFPYKLI